MIGGAKGIGIGIDFGLPNLYRKPSGKSYIEPDVLASLRVVTMAYGKKNSDSDRAIIKNLVDPDNPFIISNAAFKLNSGYGKYETELSDTRIWTQSRDVTSTAFSSSYNGLSGYIIFANTELTNSADIPSFKIQVKGLLEGQELIYRYYDSAGQSNVYSMAKDGEYTLPADIRTAKPLISNTSGFQVVKNETNTITITQIPQFEGAFVTDGVDDLITSTKTVQEMLGGSNEITVVSMIHQIHGNVSYTNGYTNYIRNSGGFIRNSVTGIDGKGLNKTGIYGYTATNLNSSSENLGNVINNILGDKKDYTFERNAIYTLDDAKYSVQNFINANNQPSNEGSSVAWYWTVIANKVLTTDQINQVIAYYNLDRTLNPDILCNVKKQRITNENHAEFGDKLIDFSGNGRDIQLNNLAWKLDSGIGKYEVDFLDWAMNLPFINERTSFTFSSFNDNNNDIITVYQRVPAATQSFLIKAKLRGSVLYRYYVNNGDTISVSYYEVKEGINILPDSADPTSVNGKVGFVLKGLSSVKVEQIPSHAGALCFDGVEDYGKVTGLPIYKDYTCIIDYERISYTSSESWTAGVVSKSHVASQGAFILMTTNTIVELAKQTYSFGGVTPFNRDDFTRALVYQSKYKCGDVDLTVGEGVDSNTLWLGKMRDNDSHFFNGAIYSLMSFPYSMSEFLIERQLKKHKLGTLYPDMVEFRPIVKSNLPYSSISYSVNPGEYISVDSMVTITVTLPNTSDKLMEVSCNAISDISISGDNGVYEITGKVGKSPQKINMIISSYLTMLSNSTLISNETLIKNE